MIRLHLLLLVCTFALLPASTLLADFSLTPHDGVFHDGFGTYTLFASSGLRRSSSVEAGRFGLEDAERRGFFAFNLTNTGFNGDAASAKLVVRIAAYRSIDLTETFRLFRYDETVATVEEMFSGPLSRQIFDDLGTGTEYAAQAVGPNDVSQTIEIDLGQQFVTDLNRSAGGWIAIGIRLDGPLNTNMLDEFVRFFPLATLDVISQTGTSPPGGENPAPIPEPSTALLLFAGIPTLLFCRFCRRQERHRH